MKWKLIVKDKNNQPTEGTYLDWKERLAIEGYNQCVYCAIHENAMGGIRNFHVEHYRPKSLFKNQENDYSNLFYSCPICNTFKSNDWPNEPLLDNSIAAYPNPSTVNYDELFTVDEYTGVIEGENVAAKYIQEKLYLNRPQLIKARRMDFLVKLGESEIYNTRKLLSEIHDDKLYRDYSNALMDLWYKFQELLIAVIDKVPHYEIEDVRR